MFCNRINWYLFDDHAVNEKFEGGLTLCNSFTVNNEYSPVVVYAVEEPNREKGHKDFLLLQIQYGNLLIRGMDKAEMEKWRYQDAIHCLDCGSVVFSVYRHDCSQCNCGKCSIDGGRDYLKVSAAEKANYDIITWDLIENILGSNI